MMRRMVLVFGGVSLLIILLRPLLFNAGFPETHDGVNHLARIANYAVAVKQGQFPPRWAPTFWAGYGYPVFNYNYPLANILALPFLAIGLSVEWTMKILLSTAIVSSVIGLYVWFRHHVSSISAGVGVASYLLAPFVFTNLYVRGAVGEVLAYAIVPWIFYAMHKWKKRQSKGMFFVLFFGVLFLALAHNIIAMLIIPCVLISIYSHVLHTKKYGLYFPILAGLAASSFFWIPALVEKSLVTLDQVNLSRAYAEHAPTFSQVLSSPWQWGFSFPGPVDTLSFSLGIISFCSLVLSIWYCIYAKRKKEYIALIVGTVFLLLFMLPISMPLWSAIPFMQYIQFPWRLLGPLTIVSSMLVAYTYDHVGKISRTLLLLCLLFSLIRVSQRKIDSYIHHDDLYYKTFAETSTTVDENRPRTLTYQSGMLSDQQPHIQQGEILERKMWNGSEHVYTVKLDRDQRITEPTAYFAGWETRVDGKKVPYTYKDTEGLLSFYVSAGTHNISTRFTQYTPARIVGNSITLFAFILVGFIAVQWKRYEQILR